MSSLHVQDRDAIWLAYFQDATYRDVARQLALPERTVKSQIRRGMKMLNEQLRDLDPAGGTALVAASV